MFKLTLSDIDLLKNSVPIIAEIIDEGFFNIDQNGISLVSPDRTMVAVVDFKILSTAFDEWKVEAPASLGLNLANLSAVLKRAKSGDRLVMESGKGRLKIRLEGAGTRTFEIPLIDVRVEKPPIEQLNFSGQIEMKSSVLEDGIADAEVVSDAVILELNKDVFKMSGKGDVSSTELEIKKGDEGILNISSKDGAIKSQYAIEYLKKMVKASKLSPNISIEFGQDYPLKISFKSIDKLHLSFVLAPRISE